VGHVASVIFQSSEHVRDITPSKYLLALEKRGVIAIRTMDDILATHLISSAALRSDNFEAFFDARRQALMDLISEAMGEARPSCFRAISRYPSCFISQTQCGSSASSPRPFAPMLRSHHE
jgi:hypothetical protein